MQPQKRHHAGCNGGHGSSGGAATAHAVGDTNTTTMAQGEQKLWSGSDSNQSRRDPGGRKAPLITTRLAPVDRLSVGWLCGCSWPYCIPVCWAQQPPADNELKPITISPKRLQGNGCYLGLPSRHGCHQGHSNKHAPRICICKCLLPNAIMHHHPPALGHSRVVVAGRLHLH